LVNIMLPWNFEAPCLFLKRASMVLLIGAGGALTYGQDRTITLSAFPATVSTAAFTTTEVLPPEKGQAVPAQFVIGHGCTQSWDVRVHAFVNADRTVKYSVVGLVNCPEFGSRSFGVFASTTLIKMDLESNEASHSGGYLMESKRALKAGETVPSLLFMRGDYYSIMSIEPAQGKQDKGDAAAQPWLSIFDERLKQSDRTLALQAWQTANDTVPGMLNIPGMFKLVP